MENFLTLIFGDVVKVCSIEKYLSEMGIKEILPKSNKHMDYSTLDIGSIRLFNKIIEYMDSHQIESMDEFVGVENLEFFEVVSQRKTEKIKIIK